MGGFRVSLLDFLVAHFGRSRHRRSASEPAPAASVAPPPAPSAAAPEPRAPAATPRDSAPSPSARTWHANGQLPASSAPGYLREQQAKRKGVREGELAHLLWRDQCMAQLPRSDGSLEAAMRGAL